MDDPGRETRDSLLSGKVARGNPLEGGPDDDARYNGGWILAPRSVYVNRLMDHLDEIGYYDPVDPDLSRDEQMAAYTWQRQVALDLLGWTIDDVETNPTENFASSPTKLDQNLLGMAAGFREEARKDLLPEVKRLQGIVDLFMSGYKIKDWQAANARADEIQQYIDTTTDNYDGIRRRSESCDPAELSRLEQYDSELFRLCSIRDALWSGVCIRVDEFIDLMLVGSGVLGRGFVQVVDGKVDLVTPVEGELAELDPADCPSELAEAWLDALGATLEKFKRDTQSDEVKTSKMYMGRDAFDHMKLVLKDTGTMRSRIARRRMELIMPAFKSPKYEEHGLFNRTVQAR